MNEPQITISASPMKVKNLLITEACKVCKKSKACSFAFGGPPEELNQVAPEMCCCGWLYPSATIVQDTSLFYLRYESEKIMHEAAAPPKIEELLSDEAVFAHIREFINGRVKYAISKYEDADEIAHLLPLYLQLQQIDQAERHYADIRKRDDEYKEAIAERDRQIIVLQERYVKAEEAITEIHRQHAKAIQEHERRALADQTRLVEEHVQLLEGLRQHPERFKVIMGSLGEPEEPMSIEEYEDSATEP